MENDSQDSLSLSPPDDPELYARTEEDIDELLEQVDLDSEDTEQNLREPIIIQGEHEIQKSEDGKFFVEQEGEKYFFKRDWSQYELAEGPPVLDDDEAMPVPAEMFHVSESPHPIDALLSKKKEKEAKKNAEKEAKMKKFLEKKAAKTAPVVKEGGDSAKQPKAKVEKTKIKEGPTIEDHLKSLENITAGSKKPTTGKLPDAYDPTYVESIWYKWWVKEGYFKPEYGLGSDDLTDAIEKRGKFVMVIPPPNVTGTLHLGHALMLTLEDVLTRWNRMCGKVTLWVPGCDHAGIATQMVVEKAISRNEGKSRHDLGREEFTKRVWQWKEQKGDRIYEQLKRMGVSVDWDRVSFTMDPKLSRAVNRAFVNLFDWGFIYRSDRLVNWSCTLKSCISDIEVDKVELTGRTLLSVPGYKEKVEFGVLTYFAYKIDDEKEIIVATTRPETMLGDVAIAVHPEDERYKELIGKTAKHPFLDRELQILADEFVDKEFGTGCVKITPAHDQNDYEVGKRHGLEFITVIDEDGNMMNNCGNFSGMKRFDARKEVVAALTALNLLRETKENPMVVPVCSRSKDIVEPLLKLQWYVNCNDMAKQAMDIVADGHLRILPEQHIKTWNHWMSGIRDWCISRQLWWGHQIPAYKISCDGASQGENEIWVAAETEAEAMEKAKAKCPTAASIKLERDQDVLDTWFSSGLFPFSVFGWPDVEDNTDFAAFFPTDLLETGHDILFFWVARMAFMSTTLVKSIPFKDVFLHSLVRDAHGRKMSKSLGNVIDPIDVIKGITLEALNKTLEDGNLDPKEVEKAKQGQKQDYPSGIPECGTDALRFALCACMTVGRDINLDVSRVQGYRFFCNKVWNAVKFSMHYLSMGDYSPSSQNPAKGVTDVKGFDRMDKWILSKLHSATSQSQAALVDYNFQDATSAIYNFWLYDLCDVYLESLKPKFADTTPENKLTLGQRLHLDVLLVCVETGLRLLAPFMPFLTEELWQRIPMFKNDSSKPSSICVARYPDPTTYQIFKSDVIIEEVTMMNNLIHAIRSTRSVYNLPNKTKTEAFVVSNEPALKDVLLEELPTICALSYTKSITISASKEEVPRGSAAAVVSDKCTVHILLKGHIDFSKEEERINKQITLSEQQIKKIKEAMVRPGYDDKVPSEVREANSSKLTALEGEVVQLREALESVKLLQSES